MVRALLDGRKTQTRRLATSPLRRVEVGDRLYVRESMYLWSAGHDAEVTFAADDARIQTGPNTGEIPDASLAAYFRMVDQSRQKGKRISRPSIHMPRWASRLTLIVEGTKVEPLQAIGEEDARSEGAYVLGAQERHDQRGNRKWILGHCRDCRGWDPGSKRKTPMCGYRVGDERDHHDHRGAGCSTSFALRTAVEPSRFQFENLWNSLHFDRGETWSDNPDVVALTFRVVRGNIDRIAA